MRKNHFLYCAQYTIYSFMYLVVAGTIFQTFMLECGIDEAKASFSISVFQIVQTATMFLLSGVLEKVKNVLVGVSIYMLSYLIPFSAMTFISFGFCTSVDAGYVILFICGTLIGLFHGCYTAMFYKMPHLIMDMKDYGKVSGQSGAMAGVFGIVMSAAVSFLISRFEYFSAMIPILIVCSAFALVAAFIGFSFTRVDAAEKFSATEKINLFKYKPFYILMVPNLGRGVSTGVINLIAIIGYHENIIDSTTAAVMVTVSQIATFVGCQSFSAIASKHKNGLLCLFSSIGLVVFMPMMIIGKNHVVFLVFYFIAFVLNMYISYAAPVIIAEKIDYGCLGQYSAWRMGLTTLGTSLGSALVPILLEWVGAGGVLLFGGISMLPFGIGYYLFEKRAVTK